MPPLSRRDALQTGFAFVVPPGIVSLIAGCNQAATEPPPQTASTDDELNVDTAEPNPEPSEATMRLGYLEIVTPEVDALCRQYERTHGITFGESDANLGGARTASLSGGGLIGIRGPLRDTETPVVRPYVLVSDIEASVNEAAEAGARVALPPMEIPTHGLCAVVIQGGIECGFWKAAPQVPSPSK